MRNVLDLVWWSSPAPNPSQTDQGFIGLGVRVSHLIRFVLLYLTRVPSRLSLRFFLSAYMGRCLSISAVLPSLPLVRFVLQNPLVSLAEYWELRPLMQWWSLAHHSCRATPMSPVSSQFLRCHLAHCLLLPPRNIYWMEQSSVVCLSPLLPKHPLTLGVRQVLCPPDTELSRVHEQKHSHLYQTSQVHQSIQSLLVES